MNKTTKYFVWGVITIGALVGTYAVYRAVKRKAGRWAWSVRNAGVVIRSEPFISDETIVGRNVGEKQSKIGRLLRTKKGKDGYKWHKIALTEMHRKEFGIDEAWVREDLVRIKRVW